MNRLAVSLQQSIHTLHARGWSARRIARELGLHRETVGRELRLSKPAKVATGSRSLCEPHREIITAALVQGLSARTDPHPKQANRASQQGQALGFGVDEPE